MNGSLIKTPSVCMSHTDIEAANNESSELDQSADELTKELFQPKPRISIGQKRKKKKFVNAPNLANAPNLEKNETRMDETIADTGNETLTQEMEKSTILDSSKKKSKKNKKEKTKKKKFRKSLGF